MSRIWLEGETWRDIPEETPDSTKAWRQFFLGHFLMYQANQIICDKTDHRRPCLTSSRKNSREPWPLGWPSQRWTQSSLNIHVLKTHGKFLREFKHLGTIWRADKLLHPWDTGMDGPHAHPSYTSQLPFLDITCRAELPNARLCSPVGACMAPVGDPIPQGVGSRIFFYSYFTPAEKEAV